MGPTTDWRDRFRAPNRRFLAWAAERPERRLLLSNESGRYLVYAWEPSAEPRPLPAATKAGYTWLSPDGETVVYVEARHDSEVGHLMRVGWRGEALQPAAPELPHQVPDLAVVPVLDVDDRLAVRAQP